MRVLDTCVAFYAASCVGLAMAMIQTRDSVHLLACHNEGCDNRDSTANGLSLDADFPGCLTYNSADTLGQRYVASNDASYDVWWDSGILESSCKIIVRSPASQSLPAHGVYLTSWSQPGCYYTNIKESFMVQYCCGTGDCNTATPAASMADAHRQALQGDTTFVSLRFANLTASGESGKQDIQDGSEALWNFPDSAHSRAVGVAQGVLQRRTSGTCMFHPTSDRISEGGRQVKASSTAVCNAGDSCALTASTIITLGRSINASIPLNLWDVISAAVGYNFTETKAYETVAASVQARGTTGYMSFTPTLYCWDGTFSDCVVRNGHDIVVIDPNLSFRACTPYIRASGQLGGTFSFVSVS